MPYKNKTHNISINNNELFDDSTNNFMFHFNEDIQKINNGELSAKKFKRKLGKSNFELFSHTANSCTTDAPQNTVLYTDITRQTNESDFTDILSPNKTAYSKAGNVLIEQMLNHSTKKSKLLEKTKFLTATDISNIGELLKAKLKNREKKPVNDIGIR